MPALESLSNAIHILSAATNREWTVNQILEVAVNNDIPLQAKPPDGAMVERWQWQRDGGKTMLQNDIGRRMIELDEDTIHGLIEFENSQTSRPLWTDLDLADAKLASQLVGNCDDGLFLEDLHLACVALSLDFQTLISKNYDCWADGERLKVITHLKFSEPILVTLDMVRVPSETIEEIIRIVAFGAATGSPTTVASDVRQVPLLRQQETAILEWLKANNHDAKNLPERENGSGTAKALARAALDHKGLFSGTTIFNKAWDRLRNYKDIKEVD